MRKLAFGNWIIQGYGVLGIFIPILLGACNDNGASPQPDSKELQLSNPAAPGKVLAGADLKIIWSGGPAGDQAKIEFSDDTGSTWLMPLKNGCPSGRREACLKAPELITTRAMLRITEDGNTEFELLSPAFSIVSIVITTPKATTVWRSGQPATIEWLASPLSSSFDGEIVSTALPEGRIAIFPDVAHTPEDPSKTKFTWNLPAGIQCQDCRLVLWDYKNPDMNDSSGVFRINP